MNQSVVNKISLFLAYLAIYVIWGTTYLAVLWGLDGMEPFVLSTLRYSIAGVLLLGWAMLRKQQWPDFRVIKISMISGTLMLVGGSGLVVVAETYIGSGHAAVVIATEPLWFLLLDRRRWLAYFSNKFVVTGLFLGFLGVALFSHLAPDSHSQDDNSTLLGTLITLAGSVLWVLGTLYADRHPEVRKHPHTLITGIQLAGSGIVCAFISLLLGDWNEFSFETITTQAWGGLIFLIVMGSIVAYAAFMWLITVQPPALVSTHTYVNPIVAVVAGALLAKEEITSLQSVSLLIVLVGVILTRKRSTQIISS